MSWVESEANIAQKVFQSKPVERVLATPRSIDRFPSVVVESQMMTSGSDTTQKLLKPAQVAERLQVSIWSVYRRIESGELPAVRIGTGPRAPIRVDADELHQFVHGQDPEKRTKAWR